MSLPYSHPSYGPTFTSTNWNSDADLNRDNTINILDLHLLSKDYGKAT